MKCPYCLENFHVGWHYLIFAKPDKNWLKEENDYLGMRFCYCPSCNKIIIQIGKLITNYKDPWENPMNNPSTNPRMYIWKMIKPKTISRAPLPSEVPPEFANDYNEACLVIADSPKASAALSRRCLQNLLREKAKTIKKDLSCQIQEVIDSKKLPSYLSSDLDAVRNIGNFSAHPIKSKRTGEIIEVEPEEAEWNLNILEQLFDFYLVQPEISRKKRENLNKKLKDAGKPQVKEN
jgi:hypothetical protein